MRTSLHSSSFRNFWVQMIFIILFFCAWSQIFFTRLEVLWLDFIMRRLLFIIRNSDLKFWIHWWLLVLSFVALVFLLTLRTWLLIYTLGIRIWWYRLLFLLNILVRSRRFKALGAYLLILGDDLFESRLNTIWIFSFLWAGRGCSGWFLLLSRVFIGLLSSRETVSYDSLLL